MKKIIAQVLGFVVGYLKTIISSVKDKGEFTYNNYLEILDYTFKNNPEHPKSWRFLFQDGRKIGCLWSEDHEHPKSWKFIHDVNMDIIGCLWSNDPHHPNSWEVLYNERGQKMGVLQASNPAHPQSWVFITDHDEGKLCIRYGDGRIEYLV